MAGAFVRLGRLRLDGVAQALLDETEGQQLATDAQS
jgi:hypothetical protein